MLIQRLIPTAVWLGSQELNCNPNINTSHCQEVANADSHYTELSKCFKHWWIHHFGKSSNICGIKSTNISSLQNNPTCLWMQMGKWNIWEETHSSPIRLSVALCPVLTQHSISPSIFLPFRKELNSCGVFSSWMGSALHTSSGVPTSFSEKDTRAFFLQTHFWREKEEWWKETCEDG